MNRAWTGRRAQSAASPPGTWSKSSGFSAMWRLAGKTASSVAMLHRLPARRVAGCMVASPPAISATPLAMTSSLWAGRYGGMIDSYQRGLMKCMTPAKTKNGPKSLRSIALTLFTEYGLGLRDAEAVLVQRPAHDHALQVRQVQVSQRLQVVQRSDPARIDQVRVGRRRHLAERLGVRPLHGPVHLYGRVDE